MSRHSGLMPLVISLILLLSEPAMSQTVTVNTRAQIVQAVDRAKPGTTILTAPGIYQGGLHFDGLQGEDGKPIILATVLQDKPPVFQRRNSCFHLTAPAYVELHNFILTDATGNGINIDDGGSYGIDPQVLSAEAGELRLKATSPVRDAGVRVK